MLQFHEGEIGWRVLQVQTASLSAYCLHPARGAGSRAKQQVGGVADGSL